MRVRDLLFFGAVAVFAASPILFLGAMRCGII